MKAFYKKTQILSILLSFIFLLQGCLVYHKTPISLDNAVVANKRMKVITTENKKYKFRKIEKMDSIYYGIALIRGQQTRVPLQRDKIQSIHPIDKYASITWSVFAVVIPIGLIIFGISRAY